MLNHVSTLLLDNGCIEEHVNVVKQLKTSYTERTWSHSVRNQQSQIKYFESKLGLILPVKESLPPVPGQLKRKRTTGDQKQTENFFYRIPLLKQLERLINFKDVYAEVNKVHTSQRGVYQRFQDGCKFKNNPLFKELTPCRYICTSMRCKFGSFHLKATKHGHSKKNRFCLNFFSK